MTINEIRHAAQDARPGIWSAARSFNRDPKIYLHWTGGNYDQTFSEYNLCILGNGEVVETRPLKYFPEATWKRNSASISITLCCARNATPDSLGDYPPTDIQIETMAQLITVLAGVLCVPIDKEHVMTHGEAANNEDGLYLHPPYAVWSEPQPEDGDTRWDLAILRDGDEWRSGGDTLRGKAIYYQKQGLGK